MSRDDMYHRLRHPLRKRIIEVLGERGRVSFTDLKREVDIGVGKLYYHLEILGGLVVQDEGRRYMLSGEGRRALELLRVGEGGVVYRQAPEQLNSVFAFFTVRPVFRFLRRTPEVGLPLLLIVAVFGAFLNVQAGLDPFLFFLLDKPASLPIVTVLKSVIGPLFVFAFCDLASTYLYRRVGNHLNLLVGIAFSQFPLTIFSLLWLIFKKALLSWAPVMYILFFTFQAWSIILLIAALNASKGVRFGQASLIVLTLTYLNIVFLNVPFLGG
jgi:hypothetical protein